MSNITKLEFAALDISGKNYLSWILDAEIHLNVMNLGNTIKGRNTVSLKDRAKALIFLRSEKLSRKATGPHNKKVYETECYRCGMKSHWSRTCRTTKHLVDLY